MTIRLLIQFSRILIIIGLSCSLSFLEVSAQPIPSDSISLSPSTRPTVGLVLSGGGAKGFTYIGLLKVIQEAGLPIDYIGGTSIGSIIGGLYAIGYHPDSIAAMIRSVDWDALLTDQMERKYLAFEEKEFAEKFIITLPVANKSISVSPALYKGQEINMMLNHYFSPAFNTPDFNDLHTPFLCIGTDLFTGDPIVLDSGYLPMAIRASMSIPGYFTPVDYNGYYLVDGGVVNNFPVKEVKEMGADIIISGDDQPPLRSTREEFTSLTGVLDQIISFNREEANAIGRELSDIYIPLDTKYGVMDFADFDSIIAFGEQTSRPYFDQVKHLADSLNAIEYKPLKSYTAAPLKQIRADELKIEGYKKVSRSYFKNYFDVVKDTVFTLAEIEKNIRFMNGSRFFQSVNYEFARSGNKSQLIIKVQESDPGYLSAGIHYDGNYGPSILLNGSFRNILGKRSKLFTDMVLGENPRFRAFYMIDNGTKPGLGARAEFYSFKFNTYEKEEKVNEIKFTNYKASVFVNYSLMNFFNIRGGFEYEYFRFKQEVVVDSLLDQYSSFSSYGNFFVMFQADTRDKAYFPSKGSKSEIRVEYVMPLSNWTQDLFTSSFVVYGKYEINIPFARKFVFRPGVFLGSTLSAKNNPPPQHWFGFGGMNPKHYQAMNVPFTGVPFIQSYGYHAIALHMKVQYNIFRKLYATLLLDAGSNENEFEDVFLPENYICGYGLSLSYDSFIGPVELTLMSSNTYTKPTLFLNLGFWF